MILKSNVIRKKLSWFLRHEITQIRTLLLLAFALQGLCANPVIAQDKKVSIHAVNEALSSVLSNLSKQSGFNFFYNDNTTDPNMKVSIDARNRPLKEVLEQLFKGKGINFKLNNKQILLYDAIENKTRNNRTIKITGVVCDEKGDPLVGVAVREKSSAKGTLTDINGAYSLDNISTNEELTFSYIGYQSRSVDVAARTTINIRLEEKTETLNEVMVTALGIKREEKALGYAVQKVNGDALQTIKSLDMGTSLTGKVSGLMVKNSSEFANAPTITLRGENPLLVIDGVPYGNMSLRDIPNDDIESISVLKGATASALYGSRGASGAIMINTIHGSKNQGLSITVNSGTMFTAGYLAIPKAQSTFGRPIANSTTQEYSRTLAGSWGPPMDGRTVVQWDPISKSMVSMPYLPIGKDNFKNFLDQGYTLNNNISLVQQGTFGSFRASATWVNNKGTYPNSTINKYTFSLGGDMKLKKFSLSSNMSFNKMASPNIGFSAYRGYDPMYSLLLLSPVDYDLRQYKDYWIVPDASQNWCYTTSQNNPYFDMYERLHTLDRDILNGMFSANYDVLPWLKATARIGYDFYTNEQKVRISQGSYTGAGISTVIGGGTEIWGESTKGSYNSGLSRGYSLNGDFLLTANKTVGDFNIDGLAGGTIYYTEYNAMESLTRGGLSLPAFYSLKASVNNLLTNAAYNQQQVNSLFGKASISWKRVAFIEGTIRNDWSSTLPKSTRSYLYPSISGSFIASEILPEFSWLSIWKLRGSWTMSKTPAGIYSTNNVYSVNSNAWYSNAANTTLSSANLPTSLKNSDINPQTSETFEVGTLINLFKNRLSLDLSYFSKRYYDFITSSTISSASGYSSKQINIDEEKTRQGIELTTTVVPIKNKKIEWSITGNWSKSIYKFTKLDDKYSLKAPYVAVGKRADYVLANDYLRNPVTNDIIHVNGMPQYSSYATIFGYSDPNWIWGLTTNLKYKNWNLKISMDGRVGGIASSLTQAYMWRNGVHPNSVTDARYKDATEGGKHYVGQGVKVTSGSVTYDSFGNITSDSRQYAANDVAVTYESYINTYHKNFAWGGSASPADIMSLTFMKVREVALTYTLPAAICKKIRANNITLSLIGNGLLLWAKEFKYADPDGGGDDLSDPSIRNIGFNVQLNF